MATPKYERLLKALAKKPMSYSQIHEWLARNSELAGVSTKLHDFALYGTINRVGILRRFCGKTKNGQWKVVRKTRVPVRPVIKATSSYWTTISP